MKAAPVQVAHCSTCGTTLNAKGECLACLVRVGFDCLPKESPDSVFGDYEIARRDDGSLWELGRGAMGVTYRAEDKVLNRSVALKVVAATAAAGAGQAVHDRFLREARAAAAFRHPNVAGVFHFGASSEGDRCYYAMELVEGETLKALVRRDGPLKVEPALEMAVQVTRALIAAAARGLVHRDLKPGNIMLTRSDDDAAASSKVEQASSLLRRRRRNLEGRATFAVKVIDFGLAKAIAESGSEKDLTQGAFVGTPAFASPEQFSGAPADARSDIYSLGVTLWYALTGEVPFEGKTIEEIRRGQSELALPLDKLVARKIPKPVIRLLRRVLSLTPAERPASAREFMEALEVCRARLGYTRPNEWKAWPVHRKLIALAGLVGIGAAAFFAFRLSGHKQAAPIFAPAKSIAVLPFQNMSDDKQNAYLADGVHEEILTTLAKVADLKVISRTTVMRFRDAEKRNLREIAQQLGVAHVLEGSVQRSAHRLRVTAQLIDARSDAHVWADRYDGDLADIFTIQSEIAQKIANQLQVALSPNEQSALRAKPTFDPAAYELYQQARQIWRDEGYTGGAIAKQVPLLDEAVSRDPAFIPALCMLAELHLLAYFNNHDHTLARLELARKPLEAAEQLRPDAGEVHRARGMFHYFGGSRDYAAALGELALAKRSSPNDAEVLSIIGAIEARQGHWDESIRSLERAFALDPQNATQAGELIFGYFGLRRYEEMRRVFDNLRAWKPEEFRWQVWRASLEVNETGNLQSLKHLLASGQETSIDPNLVPRLRRWVSYMERDYHAAEAALADYRLPDIMSTTSFVVPREYYEGRVARGLHDTARAETLFLRARERADANVATRPSDGKALMWLAKIDGMLGRKEEAMREGERAVELLPVASDAVDGPALLWTLVEVYAEVKETERALEVLERAVALPYGPTYGILLLDEDFDPLRKDPRFEKILASLAPKSISR
jgi:TolB-like protein/tRNA A-37 threonylcarbamoyl transferase component Bud32